MLTETTHQSFYIETHINEIYVEGKIHKYQNEMCKK